MNIAKIPAWNLEYFLLQRKIQIFLCCSDVLADAARGKIPFKLLLQFLKREGWRLFINAPRGLREKRGLKDCGYNYSLIEKWSVNRLDENLSQSSPTSFPLLWKGCCCEPCSSLCSMFCWTVFPVNWKWDICNVEILWQAGCQKICVWCSCNDVF